MTNNAPNTGTIRAISLGLALAVAGILALGGVLFTGPAQAQQSYSFDDLFEVTPDSELTVNEGTESRVPVTITVTYKHCDNFVSSDNIHDVLVAVGRPGSPLSGGTASMGKDFEENRGTTLTFTPSDCAPKDFTVNVINDISDEDDETIIVYFYTANISNTEPISRTITIVDNDEWPSPPSDLAATVTGPSTVELTWTASPAGGVFNGEPEPLAGYEYGVAQVPSQRHSLWKTIPGGGDLTSYTVTGLDTANHSYTFLLRARNRVYVSDEIGPVTAEAPVVPTVTSVEVVSIPGDGGYHFAEPIRFLVGFSEDVAVTGTPQLELQFDGSDTDTGRRLAEYTDKFEGWLGFLYIVQEHDTDTDGFAILENGLGLNGGAIRGADGGAADLTHAAVATDHRVDGLRPEVVTIAVTSDPGDDGTYGVGDRIEVTLTYNEEVRVVGTPQLALEFSDPGEPPEYRWADYQSHNGRDVVFAYIVRAGDRDDDGFIVIKEGLGLHPNNPDLILDIAGNWGEQMLPYDLFAGGHRVNGGPGLLSVSSFAVTSDPGDDATYGIGDQIHVLVQFTEDFTLTTSEGIEWVAKLELDFDGTARTATYLGHSSRSLEFYYEVQVGDEALDGIALGANKLTVGDGTSIQDANGVDADLSHDAQPAHPGHRVDAVAPTVASIAITSERGERDVYGVGDRIHVWITFSKEITVNEGLAIELDLDFDGTTKTARLNGCCPDNLWFIYDVQVGDMDADGIAIGANSLSLNGGSVTGLNGLAADLSHDAVPADPDHKVNAPGGL